METSTQIERYKQLTKYTDQTATFNTCLLLIAWIMTGYASVLAALIYSLVSVFPPLINLFFTIKVPTKVGGENLPLKGGDNEVLTGFIHVLFIASSAVFLMFNGVSALINGNAIPFDYLAIVIMIFANIVIIVSVLLQCYFFKKAKSVSNKANLLNYRASLIINMTVLFVILLKYFGWNWVDGVLAIIVSFYISHRAWKEGSVILGDFIPSSDFGVVSDEVKEILNKRLGLLKIRVGTINESPIKGLYEVVTDKENIYYISENGQFLVNGDIYNIDNEIKKLKNSELDALCEHKGDNHLSQISTFEKDMIVYKADVEKHIIIVFIDVSCSSCKKLHADIPNYNKAGITVCYLAFPRGGKNSDAYSKMVSIWCSDEPKVAMDREMENYPIPLLSYSNTVIEQYNLGIALGNAGTPTLFLNNGVILPGYLPVNLLLKALQ